MPNYAKLIKHLLLLVGVAILVFFVSSIDLPTIKNVLRSFSVSSLMTIAAVVILLTLLNIIFKAYRWKLLVEYVAQTKISHRFTFNSILAGVAAASILPGRVEFAKPLLLKSHYDIPLSKSFSALLVDRLVDFLSFVLIVAVGILFIPLPDIIPTNAISFVSLFIIVITTTFILFPEKVFSLGTAIIKILPFPKKIKQAFTAFLNDLLHSFQALASKRMVFFLSFITLLMNGLEILRFYYLLQILGLNISLAMTAIAFSIAILIGALTAIPGGIGVTEISAATLLAQAVPGKESMVKSAVLLDRIISYYSIIVVGAILLIFQEKFFKRDTASQTF